MKFDNFLAVDNGFANFVTPNTTTSGSGWGTILTDVYSFPFTSTTPKKLFLKLERNQSLPFNQAYEVNALNTFKNWARSRVLTCFSEFNNPNVGETTAISKLQNDINNANVFYFNQLGNNAYGYRLVVSISNYTIPITTTSGWYDHNVDVYAMPTQELKQRKLFVRLQGNSPSISGMLGLSFKVGIVREITKNYLNTYGYMLPTSTQTSVYLGALQELQQLPFLRIITNISNT
jgi:hypothetical protein